MSKRAAAVAEVSPGAPGEGSFVDSREAVDVLTAVGEAVYEWSLADDVIRWSANVLGLLGLASLEPVATGAAFARLVDPASAGNRHDSVFNSAGGSGDDGGTYDVRYGLLLDGGTRRVMIEDVGRWHADDSSRPRVARGVIRVINERYESEQRMAFLSRYDELTGYLNRSHLLASLGEALAEARRSRRPFAFLMISVDNFGAINDAYGFEVADHVFAAVARRIGAGLREGDAIGRYSGSKLGIILMDCDEAAMHTAAERFNAVVSDEVIATDAAAVAVTVSIGGIALPRHGRRVGEAVARAQESLHRARGRGFGRFFAYAPSAGERQRLRENATLSSELVAALNEGRLNLSFQPVVDAATRRPVFHEGLLRLQRANRTLVAASEFIHIAERLGLIRLVDLHVLAQAIEILGRAPSARLSINVSAETVGDATWMSRLAEAVRRQPDMAGRLIVEVTETAVIRHVEEASRFISVLHDLGAKVALDDFGVGFSSFRHLRSLEIDMVKIAGVFIEDMRRNHDDRVFVRALTDLAGHFGLDVVGEWVEDEESAELLTGSGVGFLQGNLTGAARPEWPWPVVEQASAGEAR